MTYEYSYTAVVDPARLTEEIESSDITIALDHVSTTDDAVSIFFKAQLSVDETSLLESLLAAHTGEPLPDPTPPVLVDLLATKDVDGLPIIHTTPRPMGHTSFFTSAGDTVNGQATGPKLLFSLSATDTMQSVDLEFDEDVFLKNGVVFPVDAPLGACMDIAAVHPVYGVVKYFSKCSMFYGTEPCVYDTSDCAYVPKGIIIRVTIHNSDGAQGADAPKAFRAGGRLELYRPTPPISA